MPYSVKDVLGSSPSDDIERDVNSFFVGSIPLNSSVQIKIHLFYFVNKTSVCFLWNHMCMDGGGFKAFLAAVCARYDGREAAPPFLTGPRGYKEVYRDMPEEKRKKAKRLFAGNFAPDNKKLFPFSPEKKDDSTQLVVRTIASDVFGSAAAQAKKLNSTVNDMLLYAYADALCHIADFSGEQLAVSSAVDLRRHIKEPYRLGYTNHTAFMYALVKPESRAAREILSDVSESTQRAKKDEFIGLHGLPLLSLGYHLATYAQVELIVRLFYKNPPFALSNLGAFEGEIFGMGGKTPAFLMVAGAAKHKPCAMLTAAVNSGKLTVSMCVKGNEADRKIIDSFFTEFENSLKRLAVKG